MIELIIVMHTEMVSSYVCIHIDLTVSSGNRKSALPSNYWEAVETKMNKQISICIVSFHKLDSYCLIKMSPTHFLSKPPNIRLPKYIEYTLVTINTLHRTNIAIYVYT